MLLLHWSLLNYAAVLKIVKKHDKLTGAALKQAVQGIIMKQVGSPIHLSQVMCNSSDTVDTIHN